MNYFVLYMFADPKKSNEDTDKLFFVTNIYHRLTPTEVDDIDEQIPGLLYPQLLDLIGDPDQLNEQLNAVNSYKSGDSYFLRPEEYENIYPELAKLVAWLDANLPIVTFDAIESKFESIPQFQKRVSDLAIRGCVRFFCF